MSILTAVALKPVILLTLRAVTEAFVLLGHALCDTAEARGQTLASIYLAAMSMNRDLPRNPRKRGDYDY